MGATAGFHPENAVFFQRLVAQQKLGIFPGVNVVGDHRQIVVLAQGRAQLAQQRRFARAHRAPHANAQTVCTHGVNS